MISGRRTGIAPSARRWDIHMQRFRSASLLLLAVHVPLVLSYLAAPTPAARRSDIGCPRRCTAPKAAFAAFEPPDHSLVLKDALMKKAVGRQMEAFKSVGDTALQLWLKSKWDSFSSMEHETGCSPLLARALPFASPLSVAHHPFHLRPAPAHHHASASTRRPPRAPSHCCFLKTRALSLGRAGSWRAFWRSCSAGAIPSCSCRRVPSSRAPQITPT